MTKLMNLLRRNPRMTVGGIVLVIILVAVVVWMVTRGEDKVVGPKGTGPELEVTGEKIVKSVNTSEYTFRKTEYAGPYRGWNIDFSININTKGGFKEAGITHIKIERYDDSTTPVLMDTQYTDEISNYDTFNVDFLGSALATHAVGTKGGRNTFEVYGVTTKGSDDGSGEVLYSITDGGKVTNVLLATADQTIVETDLNYTLGNTSQVKFTFDLGSSSGSTTPKITSSIIRTKYRISIDPSNVYSLVPATDTGGAVIADKYKFKKEDGTFLSVGTTAVFKIDASYGGDRYRAYTDDDKILTKENGTGALVLKKPTKMNRAESETSLMTFTPIDELYTEWGNFSVGNKYFLDTQPAPYNYSGTGVITNIRGTADMQSCITACNSNPDCHNFTFSKVGKDCYFKTAEIKKGNIHGNQPPYTSYIKPGSPLNHGTGNYSKFSDASSISAQYIRFQKIQSDVEPVIDITEVFVRDSIGNELKTGAKVTGSTPNMGVDKLKDGAYNTFGSTLDPNNTGDQTQKFRWIEMDLGGVKEIAGFWFFHVHDYYSRVQNMKVIFMDADRNIVEITPELPADDSTTRKVRHEYKIAENPRRWESVVPDSSTWAHLGI